MNKDILHLIKTRRESCRWRYNSDGVQHVVNYGIFCIHLSVSGDNMKQYKRHIW
jgi:hypothetical protein